MQGGETIALSAADQSGFPLLCVGSPVAAPLARSLVVILPFSPPSGMKKGE